MYNDEFIHVRMFIYLFIHLGQQTFVAENRHTLNN